MAALVLELFQPLLQRLGARHRHEAGVVVDATLEGRDCQGVDESGVN
jgi:hypothetical protein